MMTEVKRLKRLHRAVSIPLLQAKLKISHEEARLFVEALKKEALNGRKRARATKKAG